MKANAGIGFVLLGIAVLCHRKGRLRYLLLSYLAGAILVSLSLATLAEYALNCNLGIDELFFRDDEGRATWYFEPGRMSPVAAALFVMLVAAIVLAQSNAKVAHWGKQLCLLPPLLISARSLVGYVYGVPILAHVGQYSSMALPTILSFFVVSLGLLISQHDSYLVSLIQSPQVGSKTARRLLMATIGLPLAFGLVCLQGERFGFFTSQVGVTVFVVLMGLVLAGLLIGGSQWVNHLDSLRASAAEAARQFHEASLRDALTGLFNRRGFLDLSEQQVARARRAGSPLACILLDIDFFKKINDTHGHSTGDDVLRQFASLLKGSCRPGDLIGRIGGEEFCVLLPDTDELGASVLCRRIHAALAAQSLRVSQTELAVTSSGGVAELRPSHSGVHSLIDSADAALLIAKRTGRNKIVTASSLEEAEFSSACCGPLGKLRASDLMVPLMARIGLEQAVSETADLLMELNLDSAPVVDAQGKLAGFVTEQDLTTALLDSSCRNQSIAHCTRMGVAVFEETAAAEEIASFFSRSAVQRVVIVREGLPVGIVSRRTLLRWLLNHSLNQHSARSRTRLDPEVDQAGGWDDSIEELAASVSRLARIREPVSEDDMSSRVVSEVTRIQQSIENILIRCRDRKPRQGAELLTAGAFSIG